MRIIRNNLLLKTSAVFKNAIKDISKVVMRPEIDISNVLKNLDATQRKYLEEKCIVVDENDHILGCESKENCHLVQNINNGMIHRAFSVFLFNSHNQLLMQERSFEKITFPGYLTNTCCSHPLFNENEMTSDIISGIKNAAIRKLEHELGIKYGEVTTKDLVFKARFHYKALSDGIWGENEMDYVFIVKKDVGLQPNTEEVKNVKYYGKNELMDTLEKSEVQNTLISPWFKLIAQNFLYKWWDNLDEQKEEKLSEIYRL